MVWKNFFFTGDGVFVEDVHNEKNQGQIETGKEPKMFGKDLKNQMKQIKPLSLKFFQIKTNSKK